MVCMTRMPYWPFRGPVNTVQLRSERQRGQFSLLLLRQKQRAFSRYNFEAPSHQPRSTRHVRRAVVMAVVCSMPLALLLFRH